MSEHEIYGPSGTPKSIDLAGAILGRDAWGNYYLRAGEETVILKHVPALEEWARRLLAEPTHVEGDSYRVVRLPGGAQLRRSAGELWLDVDSGVDHESIRLSSSAPLDQVALHAWAHCLFAAHPAPMPPATPGEARFQ